MLGTITITNGVPISGTHEAISVTEMILEGGTVFVTDKVFPFELLPLASDTVDVEFDNITHTELYSETATFTIVGVSSGDSYDIVNTIEVIDSSTGGEVIDDVTSAGIRTKKISDYATSVGESIPDYIDTAFAELVTSSPDDIGNDVFITYDEAGISTWQPLASNVDLSGVSWKWDQAGTLITDQHLVWASHYKLSAGASVPFIDADGGYHNRYAVDQSDIIDLDTHANITKADVTIVKLNEPLPPNVKVYPLASRDGLPDSDYVGQPIVYTSQDQKFWIHEGVGVIEPSDADDVATRYSGRAGYTHHLIQDGDSGHPHFAVIDGELALFGVLSRADTLPDGNWGEGGYLGDPVYVDAINDIVTQLGHD